MSDRAALRASNGMDATLLRMHSDSQRKMVKATSRTPRDPSGNVVSLTPGRSASSRSSRSFAQSGGEGADEEAASLLEDQDEEEREVVEHDPEPLDETTYGFAITSLVRDSVWMVTGQTEAVCIRMGRLVISLMLIVMTSGLQLYVLYQVARLLCGKAVQDMRKTYVHFEMHMYPNGTEVTSAGHIRGVPGDFVAANFKTLDDTIKEDICQFPLAHPWFLSTILLIWTLTCLRDVRRIVNQTLKIIYVTPTVHSLAVLRRWDETKVYVDGLTVHLKAGVFAIMMVRFVTIWGLLWLGCRWLTATIGLDEMFLNGLALEFVLLLQELLYAVLVPQRHKLATQNTLILPMHYPGKEHVNFMAFFGSFLWLIVALSYVVLYVFHLQMVLPDYRWDVRDICNSELEAPSIF